MECSGQHRAKLCTARLGLRPRLLSPAGPGEGPGRILTHTSSGVAPPGPHPRQGPASEQPILGSVTGRADPRPLPNALPAPRPASLPARSLYLQVRVLYHLRVTWAENSKALFSSKNLHPTRALAAPHGSCYPNNNTESPGTSMEWGGGKRAALLRPPYPLRPRKQRPEPSPGQWRNRGPERLWTD